MAIWRETGASTSGEQMTDFLIIGGGIAGISAAARLSEYGKVIVLEAEPALGYHSSGRSAAMFEETYGSPTTIALNKLSRAFLENENGGVLSPRGLMLVGTQETKQEFAKDMVSMALQPITLEAALEKVPILDPEKITEVGYHADAWDIDTDLLMQNFARFTRKNGGTIESNQQIVQIKRSPNIWTVTSATGQEFSAKILINAAGAWADEVAKLAGIQPLGFTPLRRSIARIPAPNGLDVKDWPLIFGPGESWYAKPDAGKLLVSPAEEELSHPHDAWPEDLTLAKGIARFESVVTTTVTRLESSWAGLRTFAPDRSLVIGADDQYPTFFWLAGQGGYGIQSSPAASQLIADLITGKPSPFDKATMAALSPARFA